MKKTIPSSRFTGLAFSTLVFSVALFTAQAQAQTSCQCDWYGETTPMCENQNEGWGWENSQTCIGIKDRKSTRLNSSHVAISYAVFCLKKKMNTTKMNRTEDAKT